MNNTLPVNPVKTLHISPLLKGVMNIIHWIASLFRLWKRPWKKAAANYEEMTLLDKMYWTYKSKEIIKEPEKGLAIGSFYKGFGYTREGSVKKEKSITLSAAGDLIKNPLLETSRDILYTHIEDILFQKDISMANLESLWSPGPGGTYEFTGQGTPSLHASPAQFSALVRHGGHHFSVLNITNNHSLDEGMEVFRLTGKKLREAGIIPVGINESPGEYGTGVIIEKKGFKIGIASATFGVNGKRPPPGEEYALNVVPCHPGKNLPAPGAFTLVCDQINECRRRGSGFIIVQLHWGYEYELFPRSSQVTAAREIIEAGADVIISHHPHVIQPWELYTPRRAPHKKALITYSLGNLTSTYSAPALTLSAVLNFSISRGTIHGREDLFIDDIEFIPVVQREKRGDGKPVVEIVPLTDMPFYDREIDDIIDRVYGVPWKP
jgi:poly-gamma-glutamate capsule biosynthesis protein CapA/YwtB (metallophosphatase superfamily)